MSKDILVNYVDTMTFYISRITGESEPTCRSRIEQFVKDNVQNPRLKIAVKDTKGDMVTEETTLLQYVGMNKDNIMSPSGSVYQNTDERESALSGMIQQKLKDRKAAKNEMFRCMEIGDAVGEKRANLEQASVKININSAIGAMGQGTNLFSNKSGFNSVTAFARSLIAHAYTTAEQLLGGNFHLPDVSSILNHISVRCLELRRSNKNISSVCKKYRLMDITPEVLFSFFEETLNKYRREDMSNVTKLISTLSQDERNYLYYHQNLPHIIMDNESMSTWFRSLFSNLPTPTGDIPSLKEIDGDMLAVASIWLSEMLKDKEGKHIRIFDCDEKTIIKYTTFCQGFQMSMDNIQELLDTFVLTDSGIHCIHKKPKTFRNITVESDTDSVIYTTAKWVDWYKQEPGVTHTGYKVCALMTYFLTKSIFNCLENFSLKHGSSQKYKNHMVMKNEFLYPVMLTYSVKKVYAALTACKEGVMYDKLKPDIKGVALRSSSVCQEASDFSDHLLVDSILHKAMEGTVKADDLIKEVIDFEQSIYTDLMNGGSTFLKINSIKKASKYKVATSSAWLYWYAWDEIFAYKYGKVALPTKMPIVDLDISLITPEYMSNLATKYPQTHKRLKKYIADGNKFPNYLIVNPDTQVIPEEIKPLVKYRDIVFQSMSSVYLTLEQLGITTFDKKKKILFSDMYISYVESKFGK